MEAKPQISFIIVNHKSKEYIPLCLSSIKKNCRDFNYEIIIVNNDNDFFDYVQAEILSCENKGFGSGCNLGAHSAKGNILCFLNPDTEILENINQTINYLNTNKSVGVVGPRLITQENKTQEWCAGMETNLWNTLRNNLGFSKSKEIWNSQGSIECAWVSGAALFIKEKIFREIGGFDENFFMYFEDEDLCKRVQEKGYKIIYFPEFTIKHFGGKSFSEKKEQKRLFYESQDYYFQKHFGKFQSKVTKLLRKIFQRQ